MIEKLLENKKVWIPIVAIIGVVLVVLAVVAFRRDSNNFGKTDKQEIQVDNKKEQNSDQQQEGSEKKNEEGLSVSSDDDAQKEDAVTPPASWDTNGSGNTNQNTGDKPSAEYNDSTGNGGENQDIDSSQNDEKVSGGETPNENVQFGTIF